VVEATAADPDTITGPSSVAVMADRTLVGDTACAAGTITSREADTITREAVITVAAGTTAAVVATSRETMDTMEDEAGSWEAEAVSVAAMLKRSVVAAIGAQQVGDRNQ